MAGATALVTGGASGLGKATAVRLHSLGANVVVVDRDATQGERLVAELGSRAAFVCADVTNSPQLQAAVDLAVRRFGKIDILVNCAGITMVDRTASRSAGPAVLEGFKRVIDVNLVGTFDAIRLSAQRMVNNEPNADGERGVVINTASIAAFEGLDGSAAYSASKAAVAGMTLPLARDFAGYGIRAVAIAPGTFETAMQAGLPQPVLDAITKDWLFPQRLGRPEEYALLVQHIVENPMLNGETIRLDGGSRIGARPRAGKK